MESSSLTSITKLDALLEEFKASREELNQIVAEKAQSLRNMLSERSHLIDWYCNNKVFFMHPTIQYVTMVGPILGMDEKERDVFVYEYQSGMVYRYSRANSRKKEAISFEKIVELDQFDNAVSGLEYLNHILDDLVKDMREQINKHKGDFN
ncbi:hypothetical protein SAMN05421503_2275 [Terribacillus aidingensis]|uniref:Uncharacterized protein n=1 Tax=Terribacillus aidingensis TaxID=586416 RepID=A0A285P244_9BACI|nr:hypothetical protein [Terribacillus aidingensis]SNZ14226.1 hypothetical protein SAMN05421503_2275 [Terribacillus aidingensis]